MPAGEPSYWTALHPQGYRSWADPIGHLAWPEGVREALEKVTAKVSVERDTAENALTEAQFVEAMRQALACGDFTKLCTVGTSSTVDGRLIYTHLQAVTYEPFRRARELKARIDELEKKLAAVKAALEPFFGRCD